MRTALSFLLCTLGCLAQRPEDQVLAVYKQMEKAEQTGDANTWVGLWSRESASNAEKMRSYLRPRPDVHYTASRTFVQGDRAALLGQSGPTQFLSMRFVAEDSRWKIKDVVWGEKAFPPDSVYALAPPAAGAFERAGAPWQSVAAAEAAKRGWQVRAIYDESFLYVRIESSSTLPAPGSPAETPPSGWPVMKIAVSGVGEFVLYAGANIGDQATFDEKGRANSHRHFVSYSQRLERSDNPIFESFAGLESDPLIEVTEHSLGLRVPIRALGISGTGHPKIILSDAQWPKSAIFSLEVPPYR